MDDSIKNNIDKSDIMNQNEVNVQTEESGVTIENSGTQVELKNAKERLYDKIPISVATLDLVVKGLFIILGIILVYVIFIQ
ncbi:MAG: hypothetical protein KIC94_08690 [Clostridiales bacterium]|nr:hypothetical protein [Clostridiales bacterium]